MKRFSAIVVSLLLVIVAAFWLRPSKLPPSTGSTGIHQHAKPAVQAAAPSTPDQTPQPKVQRPGAPYEPEDPRWKWWNEMYKKDSYFEWRTPINFYGKVVDYSTSTPISGVEVKLVWNDLSPEGSSRGTVITDAEGAFSLTGIKGKGISVQAITRDGYVRSKVGSQFSFEYAAFFEKHYHQPDPNKPVIFRMKKKGVAEPLVYRDTLYGIAPDGTPHYLDLKTGSKTVGGAPCGDLELRLTRADSGNPDRPDWALTIQGVGGAGLAESAEEFMFEAPADGYVNQVRVEQRDGSPDYQSQTYRNYYVRLADGKTFARIETHVFSRYNEGAAVNVTVYLNPSGSRNLEYDPAKAIRPPR